MSGVSSWNVTTPANVDASTEGDTEGTGCTITRIRLAFLVLPILAAVTCVMNAVAFLTLVRLPKGVDATSHVLIASLALSGCLVPALVLVSWFGSYSVCGIFGGKLGCSLIGWILTFLFLWGGQIPPVISLLRYLAVVKPLTVRYGCMSGRKALCIPGFLLVYSMAFTIHSFFTGPEFHFYKNMRICALDFAPGRGGSMVHRAILGCIAIQGIILIVLTIFVNVYTTVKVIRQKRKLYPAVDRDLRSGRALAVSTAAAADLVTETTLQARPSVTREAASVSHTLQGNAGGGHGNLKASVGGGHGNRRSGIGARMRGSSERAAAQRNRFTGVMAAVSVSSVICYGPFLVRLVYDVIVNHTTLAASVHRVGIILMFCNHLVNPIIYVIFNRNYRKRLCGRHACGR